MNDLNDFFPQVTFGNTVQIIGLKNVSIGEGSCIADDVWLNICVRDEKVRLKIGKCVLVGRQSMISTGGGLEVGDYCLLAPRVYISDADHVFNDINQPIIQQGATLSRSVIVEENCWLGINTVITGNLTVGRGSIVAANAVVKQDIPPFCVVAGNPAQIIKMYNPKTQKWERAKSQDEQSHIFKCREEIGIPTRTEYQQILARNSRLKNIEPLVAGRGVCI